MDASLGARARLCKPILSLLLLRSAPWACLVEGVAAMHLLKPGFRPLAGRFSMSTLAFSPAWVDALPLPNIKTFLRGGGESEQCKFCTKAHGSPSVQCKAERIATARASVGRRTHDGWALLSTMRDPGREAKVGQPKGWDGYGWGSVGAFLL